MHILPLQLSPLPNSFCIHLSASSFSLQIGPVSGSPLSVAYFHFKGTQLVLQNVPQLVHRQAVAKVPLTLNLLTFLSLPTDKQPSRRLSPLNFLIVSYT